MLPWPGIHFCRLVTGAPLRVRCCCLHWDRASCAGAPGDTELVSVALDGSAAGFADQSQTAGPAVSADGRYVAFVSGATNLVTNDTNGFSDTFVRDRLNGTVERMSVATDGSPANGSSEFPAISPDGRFVAFTSVASNLVAGDTNEEADIFVHDRQTGQTQRVNVSSGGAQANRISSDGGNERRWALRGVRVPRLKPGAERTPTITPTYSCGIGRPAQLSA